MTESLWSRKSRLTDKKRTEQTRVSVERRMLQKLLTVLEKSSHPLHNLPDEQRSSFSKRTFQLRCDKENATGSLLHTGSLFCQLQLDFTVTLYDIITIRLYFGINYALSLSVTFHSFLSQHRCLLKTWASRLKVCPPPSL